MHIQHILPKNSYHSYAIYNQNQSAYAVYPVFCGASSDNFISKSNKDSLTEDIQSLMDELNSSWYPFVSKSKARDIMTRAIDYAKTLKQKKEDLDGNWDSVSGAIALLTGLMEEHAKSKYNISKSDKSYDDLEEQVCVVSEYLNGKRDKLTNPTNSAPGDIVYAMRDFDGKIYEKDFDVLDKIINRRKKCDVSKLPVIIQLVKDDYGDFDPEKAAEFIGKDCWNKSSISSIIDFMKKKYPQDAENSNTLEKIATLLDIINESDDVDCVMKKLDLVSLGMVSKTCLGEVLNNLLQCSEAHDQRQIRSIQRVPILIDGIDNIEKHPNYRSIESAVRNIYGITDENIKEYAGFGEQIRIVSRLLNKKKDIICTDVPTIPEDIAKSMQNKDGVVTEEDITFLKRIFDVGKETRVMLLPTIMKLVKDENGNLDSKKVTAFMGAYSWDGATLDSALDFIAKEYYSDSPEVLQEVKTTHERTDERKKVEELVDRINEVEVVGYTGSTHKEYRATIMDNGLIRIEKIGNPKNPFYPYDYGCGSNWAFEHIGEIIGDIKVSYYTLGYDKVTSLGSLYKVVGKAYCNDKYDHMLKNVEVTEGISHY